MNVTGAVIELATLLAWATILPLLFYGLFGVTFNYWAAAQDAALLLIYFAVELGYGGGKPIDRSGL